MKIIRTAFIILFIMAAFTVGMAYLLPSEYSLERSIVTKVEQKQAFNAVADLREWQHWSPRAHADPEMMVTYGQVAAGKGASFSWKGPESGEGTLTNTGYEEYTHLENHLEFVGMGSSETWWNFKKVDNGTEITRGLKGDAGNNPFERIFGALIDMSLGPMYEDGLHRLKFHLENPEKELRKEGVKSLD